MPHEMLKTMRVLREDMRQRLEKVPEYRALVALDRSIEEICEIIRDTPAQVEIHAAAPEPVPAAPIEVQQTTPAPARQNAIAAAFAGTLAAKMDQRLAARVADNFAQRAIGA